MLEDTDLLKAMGARKVTAARIQRLRAAADELSGMLADRSAAKGAGKGVTREVRNVVKEQKRTWSACYRILALVAHADDRVRHLLADASASR